MVDLLIVKSFSCGSRVLAGRTVEETDVDAHAASQMSVFPQVRAGS